MSPHTNDPANHAPDELEHGGAAGAGGVVEEDNDEVSTEDARTAWAAAGHAALLEVARQYHATITYKELAAEVQQASGIISTQLMHYWIGDVLGRIAAECARRGQPLLTSLCVNAEGSVGASYGPAVEAATGTLPADADDHAAAERLACHRYVGAAGLPANGGVATLTPRLKASRERGRKARREAMPIASCPTCYVALPSTGVCDSCG